MNRLLTTLLALLVALATQAPLARSNQTKDLRAIYDKIDRVLVTVEYKAEMTFMGQSDDIEGRVMGLSVQPQGMVIFDGTSLGTGSHFGAEFIGAPRVEKPKTLKVTDYRGNEYDAEFIGVDQFSSIAFCRLPDSVKTEIAAAEFEAADLTLGEELYTFWLLPKGYEPRFQMDRTMITGILSKPETFYLTGELNTDFIMAPLVTATGTLVGVVTPMAQNGGRGGPFDMGNAFGDPVGAMPVSRFLEMLAKPPAPDEFTRGWLGIAMQALDPEIAEFWHIQIPGGIIVNDVVPHSPADRSGLKAGDFVVAVDEIPLEITDDADLTVFQKMISERGDAATMDMTVIRPGDEDTDTLRIPVTLGAMPTAPADAPKHEDSSFDMTVRDLVFVDFNARDLEPDEISGVVVDKIEPGGWAAVDGLRPGDIILKINDREIGSVDDARAALAEVEQNKDRKAVFMVWRLNKTQFVNVKTHWE